ncbi:proteasome stabiliser-domain-containing protein [Coniochaeta sp. 2T2.1]|nr:proteasome stabiliser-domain-containing protein [Coniochaeta sp. 2T2.1]
MASAKDADLKFIDEADFRVASYSNDEPRLQIFLGNNLTPLLEKAKNVMLVQRKLIPVTNRIQTFTRSPTLILPLALLVEQFKASPDYTFVRYFDIIFIRQGLDRPSLDYRIQLIPKVLKGIGSDQGKYVDALFNIFLRLLNDLRLPPRGSEPDGKLRGTLGLDDPKDAEFVAQWLGKLFLVVRDNQEQSLRRGLTEDEYKFLVLPTAKGIWRDEGKDTRNLTDAEKKAPSLTETCKKAVKFLESGAFTDAERFVPAIYASAHPNEAISSIGNDMLKRTSLSTDDPRVLKDLFAAYEISGYGTRTRILRLLSTSRKAATYAEDIYAIFRVSFGELGRFLSVLPARLSDTLEADDSSSDDMDVDVPEKPTPIQVAANLKAVLQLLNWVARVGLVTDELADLSVVAIKGMRLFLDRHLGWPEASPSKRTADDVDLRNHTYETIAILAKAHPVPDDRIFDLLEWLLISLLQDESPDAVIYLNSAVSAITSAFRPKEQEVIRRMGVRLEQWMVRPGPSPRHAAAKIANDCMPFTNVTARWIDILATSGVLDARTDVVDEGRRGLDPWTYYRELEGPRTLPDWRIMALEYMQGEPANFYSHGPSAIWVDTSETSGMQAEYRAPVDFLDSNANFRLGGKWAKALAVAVDYCQKILYLTALPDFKVQPGWEGQLKVLVNSDKKTRDAVRTYLADGQHAEALLQLLAASLSGMQLVDDNVQVAEMSARSFAELASLAPKPVVGKLASRVGEIKLLLTSSRRELRLLGAKAIGILGAHPANKANGGNFGLKTDLVSVIRNVNHAKGSELGSLEGVFLGAAHLLSRQIYYGTMSPSEVDQQILRGVPTIESTPSSSMEFVIEAFTQLWTAGIPAFGEPEGTTDRTAFNKKAFIDPLSEQAKKGKESAIRALGRLAIAADSPEVVDLVLSKLYELHEVKQAEVHLAVGEAIAAAVACWDSKSVQLTLDVESETDSYRMPKRSEKLVEVLDKLLEDSKNTKPSLVKASGMVLYCIIQYCSHVEEVQARLRDSHIAFMRLLTARDDLVQETASRALALIYESGGASLKDALVRDFVAFFTGSGQQLNDDDEPAASDNATTTETAQASSRGGKSSISYKDIVRLANEAGDQKLVYKFMILANSAINWSSESAFSRFGLRDILSNPEVGIDEKLYPILFRSRFDPSPRTQKSMRAIWNAMVKDSNAVLETHFDAIMKSLLKSMLGREWRVRQASCAAVKDLIEGRPFKQYQVYYKDMLAAALKLLDDMKESARLTALAFFSYLSQALLKQLEENASSASTTEMMDEILPFLLSDRGVDSSVTEVKTSAAVTVQEIAKRGGKALRPYIAMMVPCLLGLLSTYEPELVTYAYQLSGQDTREELDKRRAAAVYQGSIFEATTNCLRYADKKAIADLVPVLEDTMKSAVGMPTKIGCSGVIVHLADRHREDFEPHAGRFLQLMKKEVLDRNDTVSKNYAKAAACLLKIASSEDQVRLVEYVLALWFSSEEDVRRRKVVDVVLGIRHSAPEHFDALEALLVPFVFMGMNELTDEYVHKQCEHLWSAVGGSPHKVARYISEIVELIKRSLSVGNWAVKHAGALTSGKVVMALDEGRIANAINLGMVRPVLEKSLALKTFAGKEALLQALSTFARALRAIEDGAAAAGTGPLSVNDGQLTKELMKIAIREAKRNNEAYRPHAFKCLSEVAVALKVDALDEISDIVGPSIVEFQEDEGNDSDLRVTTVVAAIKAISSAAHEPNMLRDPLAELTRVIWALEKHAVAPKATPYEQTLTEQPILSRPRFEGVRATHWYPAAQSLLTSAAESCSNRTKSQNGADQQQLKQTEAVVGWFAKTLDLGRTQHGTEAQRTDRARAMLAAAKLWGAFLLPDTMTPEQKADIAEFEKHWCLLIDDTIAAEERAAGIRQIWHEAARRFGGR